MRRFEVETAANSAAREVSLGAPVWMCLIVAQVAPYGGFESFVVFDVRDLAVVAETNAGNFKPLSAFINGKRFQPQQPKAEA